MRLGLLIWLLIHGCYATAQIADGRIVDGNIFPGVKVDKNYVQNSQANINTRLVGTSIHSVARSTTTPIMGVADFEITASGAGITTWTTLSLESSMNGQNCEFSGIVEGGGASWTAVVRVGSDTVASLALPSSSTPVPFILNTICSTSAATTVGFSTTGSAPVLNVDELYFGRATNLGTVSQASFVGGIEQGGAAGCVYAQNTSTGINNFIALGTGTGCNSWTSQGAITAQGTNDHRAVYSNMAPGNYLIILQAGFRSTVAGACNFRLTDGTNNFQPQFLDNGAGASTTPSLSFHVSYTTSGNRTFQLQASDNHAGSCQFDNGTVGGNASWKFYRFPTSAEQVFRADTIGWKVDANISGANPTLGTSGVSAYTEITNATLNLTNNSGLGNIPAQIPCSGTNPSTGTNCAVGNESLGVVFNLPAAGDVEVCAYFNHFREVTGGSNALTAFQLIETPNNAQTPILQEGKTRIGPSGGAATAQTYTRTGNVNCGWFSFSSAGQKTIRLTYEQSVVGTIVTNTIQADGAAPEGQPDIRFTVTPLNQVVPAPLIGNSVTTSNRSLERIERAWISFAASPTISNVGDPSAPWLVAGTRHGTGDNTFTFSPAFSSVPSCSCQAFTSVGDVSFYFCNPALDAISASSIRLRTRQGLSTAFDAVVMLTCTGAR